MLKEVNVELTGYKRVESFGCFFVINASGSSGSGVHGICGRWSLW